MFKKKLKISWLLKRRILLAEKWVLAVILLFCFFKIMVDPPFVITFFKVVIIIIIPTAIYEIIRGMNNFR